MKKNMWVFVAALTLLAACKKDASEADAPVVNNTNQNATAVSAADIQSVEKVVKTLNLPTKVTPLLVKRIIRNYGSAEGWQAKILSNRATFAEYKKHHALHRDGGANYQIRLVNENEGLDQTIQCSASTFILDCAEENGINLAQCDRSGASPSCACKVQGHANLYVDQANQSFLGDCEQELGFILPCAAFPTANMTLYTGQEEPLFNTVCITGTPPTGGGSGYNGGGGATGGGTGGGLGGIGGGGAGSSGIISGTSLFGNIYEGTETKDYKTLINSQNNISTTNFTWQIGYIINPITWSKYEVFSRDQFVTSYNSSLNVGFEPLKYKFLSEKHLTYYDEGYIPGTSQISPLQEIYRNVNLFGGSLGEPNSLGYNSNMKIEAKVQNIITAEVPFAGNLGTSVCAYKGSRTKTAMWMYNY